MWFRGVDIRNAGAYAHREAEMPFAIRVRLGAGLLLLVFAAIYFDRTHGPGFTPGDQSMVLFLSVFGVYLCVRALSGLFRKHIDDSRSKRP